MELDVKEIIWCRCNGMEKQKNFRMKIYTQQSVISLTNSKNQTEALDIDRFVKRKIPLTGNVISLVFDLKHPLYKDLPGRPRSLKLVFEDDEVLFEAVGRVIMALMEKKGKRDIVGVAASASNQNVVQPVETMSSIYDSVQVLSESIVPSPARPSHPIPKRSTEKSSSDSVQILDEPVVKKPPCHVIAVKKSIKTEFALKEFFFNRKAGFVARRNVRLEINTETGDLVFKNRRDEMETYNITQFVNKEIPLMGKCVSLIFNTNHSSYSLMKTKPLSLKLDVGNDRILYDSLRTCISELHLKFATGETSKNAPNADNYPTFFDIYNGGRSASASNQNVVQPVETKSSIYDSVQVLSESSPGTPRCPNPKRSSEKASSDSVQILDEPVVKKPRLLVPTGLISAGSDTNNNSKSPLLDIPVEEVVWLKEGTVYRKLNLRLKIDRKNGIIRILDLLDQVVEYQYHIDQFEIRSFAPTGDWVALVFNKNHRLYSEMSPKAEVMKIKLGVEDGVANSYKDVVTIIKSMMDQNRMDQDECMEVL